MSGPFLICLKVLEEGGSEFQLCVSKETTSVR